RGGLPRHHPVARGLASPLPQRRGARLPGFPELGPPRAFGDLLVLAQGVRHSVRVHLAARDLSALPLRPAHAARMEMAAPALARQHPDHRARARDEVVRMNRLARMARSLLLVEMVQGMLITLKNHFRPHVTLEYPKETPDLAPRFRGVPRLRRDPDSGEELCVGCLLCEQICPDDCIKMVIDKRPGGKGKY